MWYDPEGKSKPECESTGPCFGGAGAFGCSVHWITPGIDDGPLLNVIDQPIDLAGNLLDQTAALYPLAIPPCSPPSRRAGHPA